MSLAASPTPAFAALPPPPNAIVAPGRCEVRRPMGGIRSRSVIGGMRARASSRDACETPRAVGGRSALFRLRPWERRRLSPGGGARLRLDLKAEDGDGGGDGDGGVGNRFGTRESAKEKGFDDDEIYSVLEGADLFDYNEEGEENLDEDLEELMNVMDDNDDFLLAMDDEEDDEVEGRFASATANLEVTDEIEDSFFLDGMMDELDDEALLELLEMDGNVDPEDLLELERILDEKTRLDDLMDEEQIVGRGGSFSVKNESKIEDRKDALATSKREPSPLEKALLQGVVPADAGVGSSCLPGDYGFDPLNLSTKDYFKGAQRFLSSLFPDSMQNNENNMEAELGSGDGGAIPERQRTRWIDEETRPQALILRDYREAEIRHGRLVRTKSFCVYPQGRFNSPSFR